ncbi:hypothetical protein OY671_009639, partial [Metschnikowia pulcherrima]
MEAQQKPLNSGFGVDTTPEDVMAGVDLHGKVAIVTGGHSGIGLETTRALVHAGAAVVVGARSVDKAHETLSDSENIEISPLDLASPTSVDAFAAAYSRTRS